MPFCGFCLFATHIRAAFQASKKKQQMVIPLAVISFLEKVGYYPGQFQLGEQADCHEFITKMLEDFNMAAFTYKERVPNSYEKEVFMYKLFWMKREKTTVCGRKQCGHKSYLIEEESNMTLNLVTTVTEKVSKTKPVNFDECLADLFKAETLGKQDMLTCDKCCKKT